MPTTGLEQPYNFGKKTTKSKQGGAESGALTAPPAVSDPELAQLIDAWATLPVAVRHGILAMVHATNRQEA